MFQWIALMALVILAFSNASFAYDPQSIFISFERGLCFGTCPVYRISLHGDGTVRYDGKDHVRVRPA